MHLDARAEKLAAEFASMPDDLMIDTRELARLLGLSTTFVEDARSHGTGPVFRRFGRAVRYRCGDVREWLVSRAATRSEGGVVGREIMATAKRQIARRRVG